LITMLNGGLTIAPAAFQAITDTGYVPAVFDEK